MTEQPDPTRELDMSELIAEVIETTEDPDVPAAGEQAVDEGETPLT